MTMTIRKPNITVLLVGIFLVSMFAISFYFSWTDRYIRLNGELRKTEIINIRHFKGGSGATVSIEGNNLNAGRISRNYLVGDSILIRYIPNEYCVVQESVQPNRYYLYFALESILLIIGIALIVESLKGKSFSYYYTSAINFNQIGDNLLKWISKKLKR